MSLMKKNDKAAINTVIEKTKKEWEEIFDIINEAITIHDKDFNIIRANKAAAQLLEMSIDGILHRKCYEYYHGADRPPERCPSCQTLRTGAPSTTEMFEPNLNKYLEIKALPRFDENRNLVGLVHVVRDITEQRKAVETLQRSEEKYHSLVESTEDSICLVDEECKYIFINNKQLLRMGLKGSGYIGQPYEKYHSKEETADFIEKVSDVFRLGSSVQHEYKSRRDGKFFLRTLSPVMDAAGKVTAVNVVSKNINELKVMEKRLRELTITDELTGLNNRRGLLSLAEQQLKVADRLKKKVLVIYIDLDGFKLINDKFGHNEGDKLLVETAEILKKSFRASDLLARIGGDEFVIMAIETPDSTFEKLSHRLRSILDVRNAETSKPYKLTLSLGAARYDYEHPLSIDKLLSDADRSMYEDKKNRGPDS